MTIAPRSATGQRGKRVADAAAAARGARTPPPPSRRDEARALFRNAILDAAEEVLAERGLHGARIQDIADRARMAVGTIYNYFGQKDDVLHVLLEERTAELTAALAVAPGDPTGLRERITVRLRRMFAQVDRHRGFFALALEHGLLTRTSDDASRASGDRRRKNVESFRAEFRRMVKEGIEADVLAEVDPDLLAHFLGGAIRALVFHRPAAPSTSEERADAVLTLFFNGAMRRADTHKSRP